MRLKTLKDVYLGKDIYIVGAGPSVNLFPMEYLRDKVCISLNDTYKMHPSVKPVAIMNNPAYAHTGHIEAPLHENFKNILYPVVKMTGRHRSSKNIDWDHPHYYCYDWSHNIDTNIWAMSKETDYLYSAPEGCILHEALQLAWIMGARNIFVIGCDSRTMGGRHYADFNKDGFSADEQPKGVYKKGRNYDSYVYGTLIVKEFLKQKGVNVFNLSNIVGYHMVDFQFEVLKGNRPFESVLEEVRKLAKWEPDSLQVNSLSDEAPTAVPAGKRPTAEEHRRWFDQTQKKLRRGWAKKVFKERFEAVAPKPVKRRLKNLKERWSAGLRRLFYKRDYKASKRRFEITSRVKDAAHQGYEWVYVLRKKTPDRSAEDRFSEKGGESGGRFCVHYFSSSKVLPKSKRYYFSEPELLLSSIKQNPHLWGAEVVSASELPSGSRFHAEEWKYAREMLGIKIAEL